MKEAYKILLQGVLYSTVGVFLLLTLTILMLRYGIWLWGILSN